MFENYYDALALLAGVGAGQSMNALAAFDIRSIQ
jgi:hypothetical protein